MTIILLNCLRTGGGRGAQFRHSIVPIRSIAVAANIDRIASPQRGSASREISTRTGKFLLTYRLSPINSGFYAENSFFKFIAFIIFFIDF